MRRAVSLVLLAAVLVACSLLWGGCFMPTTPTPHLGQTAARDATSQAQGTEPEGVQPGVPRVPPSATRPPSFPTPGTPGVVASPAPPTVVAWRAGAIRG